jgi:hypothetical protein
LRFSQYSLPKIDAGATLEAGRARFITGACTGAREHP